jgi:hypothetical protein
MDIYPYTEAAIPGWSFGGVYRITKKRFFEEIVPIMLPAVGAHRRDRLC